MSWSDAEAEKIRKGVAPEGARILDRPLASIDNPNIVRAATYVDLRALIDPRLYEELERVLGRAMLWGKLQEGETVVEVIDPTPPSPSIALEVVKLPTDEFVPVLTEESVKAYLLSKGTNIRSANTRAHRFGWNLTQHVFTDHVWNRNRGHNRRGQPCVDCMCPLKLVNSVTYPFSPGQMQPAYRMSIEPRSLVGMSLLSDEKIKEIMTRDNESSFSIFVIKSIELLRELAAVIERDLKGNNV